MHAYVHVTAVTLYKDIATIKALVGDFQRQVKDIRNGAKYIPFTHTYIHTHTHTHTHTYD